MSIGARLLRTRWLVRAPIWLFRARLGVVFGGRVLLLEHVGRASGLTRYVALETVARPDPDTVVVASGFGTGSQWYQNLIAQPRCRVSIGVRYRAAAVADPLAPHAAASVLADYRSRHRRAFRELSSIVTEATGHGIDTVPMVRLSLRSR